MGPTFTVMVYPSCRPDFANLSTLLSRDGQAGTGAPRVLTQPITLIRDLDCIRRAEAYFAHIKADWATPHPPTPRRPVR